MNRLRRLRRTEALRELVAETSSAPSSCLIYPIFVDEGISEPYSIETMPGVQRIPETMIGRTLDTVQTAGVRSVMLFGVSHHKDPIGSDTLKSDGLLARMVSIAKREAPDVIIIADLCFCEYTDHGHCGVVSEGDVDNDATVQNLARQAVVAAQVGADLVAPSAMMDGQVGAIRRALDDAGFPMVPIMAYSTKCASPLYGPFRLAGGTSLKGGRHTYMMDKRNRREAIRESLIDEAEGADILMVKPGLHYLDLLRDIRERTLLPIAVYHVSGEYAMLKFAARHNAFDEAAVLMETMNSFRRAGADLIITYSALDYASLVTGGRMR
jgi:porphobilinogen synthase